MSGDKLTEVLDTLARDTFGITKDEAIEQSICISCRQPLNPSLLRTIDRDEYYISGFCPGCFADLEDEEE